MVWQGNPAGAGDGGEVQLLLSSVRCRKSSREMLPHEPSRKRRLDQRLRLTLKCSFRFRLSSMTSTSGGHNLSLRVDVSSGTTSSSYQGFLSGISFLQSRNITGAQRLSNCRYCVTGWSPGRLMINACTVENPGSGPWSPCVL